MSDKALFYQVGKTQAHFGKVSPEHVALHPAYGDDYGMIVNISKHSDFIEAGAEVAVVRRDYFDALVALLAKAKVQESK